MQPRLPYYPASRRCMTMSPYPWPQSLQRNYDRRLSSNPAAASLLSLPLSGRVTRSPCGGSDAPVAVQQLRLSFPCLYLTGLLVPRAAAATRLAQ